MSETLIDMIAVACVVNGVSREAINEAPFGVVTARLYKVLKDQPKAVALSATIRETVPMCHWECHCARLRQAMFKGVVEPLACMSLEVPASATRH
jgi:hypothetical protein